MKRFREYLTEEKRSHYWLAFDIPHGWGNHDEVVNQLKAGELHGVQGIAKDKRIVKNMFHTARNALLVMHADKVHELNPHLKPIEYDNAESMMANGMRDFHRVWAKKQNPMGTSQVMGQIFENAARDHQRETKYHSSEWGGSHPHNLGSDIHRIWMKHDGETPEINSVADFKYHVQRAIDLDEKDQKDYSEGRSSEKPVIGTSWGRMDALKDGINRLGGLHQVAHRAAKEIHRTYGDEGEVSVNAPSFKVPKGSKLIITAPINQTAGIRANHAELDTKGQGGWKTKWDEDQIRHMDKLNTSVEELKPHYDIKMIDSHHYSENRTYPSGNKTRLEKKK